MSTHCVLQQGDKLGDYVVSHKLGSGRFSTVYACKNANGDVAIKAYRNDASSANYHKNEVDVFANIGSRSATNVIKYFGSFSHVSNGKNHPCIVFQAAKTSASKLIRYWGRVYGRGLPIPMAKSLMRDLFRALCTMHETHIHTDIKPANLLLDASIEDIELTKHANLYIGDLGSSTPASQLFRLRVGTAEYVAPELIIEQKYTSAVDIWAAFATCFEFITGDLLFDIFDECDIKYSEHSSRSRTSSKCSISVDLDDLRKQALNSDGTQSDSDSKSSGCSGCSECCKCIERQREDCPTCSNCIDCDGCQICEQCEHSRCSQCTECAECDENNACSFDDEECANLRHLQLIERFCGPPTDEFLDDSPEYYVDSRKSETRLSISDLLKANYDFEPSFCEEFGQFISTGIRFDPAARCTAQQALNHPFLLQ